MITRNVEIINCWKFLTGYFFARISFLLSSALGRAILSRNRRIKSRFDDNKECTERLYENESNFEQLFEIFNWLFFFNKWRSTTNSGRARYYGNEYMRNGSFKFLHLDAGKLTFRKID